MDAKRLVQHCHAYADDRKAEDPVILDVRGLSTVTDYFLLVTGRSRPHLRAIGEEVLLRLRRDHGIRPRCTDGAPASSWMVIDYGDVMVHIMSPEVRVRYDLESLWGDAPRLQPRRPRGMGRSRRRGRTGQSGSES